MNYQAFQSVLNNSPEMLAGVQRLRRGQPKEGYSAPYGNPITDPGSRYWETMPRPSALDDDEPPNPFGGGGSPYVPGAMLPSQNMMAGVFGLPPGTRMGPSPGRFIEQGPSSNIEERKKEAERRLRLDLMEPPNPFGGGSAPYGAMIPGAPGNLMGMQRFG
jgi:hypothetical protein